LNNRLRRILTLSLIAAMATLFGCGGGASSSDSGTPGTSLPARTLSWESPTTYTDQTAMNPATDLDRFEIYVNESGTFTDADTPAAELSAINPDTHQLTASFNLANLSPNVSTGHQYHVSLRAVAISGLKSDFSPSVSFSF
jgi:hypothetical protein